MRVFYNEHQLALWIELSSEMAKEEPSMIDALAADMIVQGCMDPMGAMRWAAKIREGGGE